MLDEHRRLSAVVDGRAPPESRASAISAALVGAGIAHLDLTADTEQTEPRVTVVPASVVKGLEFDHVVLLNPPKSPPDDGLNRLYVALTRAISLLTIIHNPPCPPTSPRREHHCDNATRPLRNLARA